MTIDGSTAEDTSGSFRSYALSESALVTEIGATGTGGASAYLRSPDGGLFRIGPKEYFLLQGLCAGMTTEAVSTAALAQIHLKITPQIVSDFAEQMVSSGILVHADAPEVSDQAMADPVGPPGASLMNNDSVTYLDEEDDEDLDETEDLSDTLDTLSLFVGGKGAKSGSSTGAGSEAGTGTETGARFGTGQGSSSGAGAEPEPEWIDPDPFDPEDIDFDAEDAENDWIKAAMDEAQGMGPDHGDQSMAGVSGLADPRVTERTVKFTDTPEPKQTRDMDIVLFNPTGVLRFVGGLFWLPGYVLNRVLLLPLGIVAVLSILHRLDEVRATILSVGRTMELAGMLAISLVTVNLVVRLVQGVTIQRHGGEVKRFGLTFMLFIIPRFTIDMRGIFKMDREGRIAVFAAALKTRFLIFTLCTLIWAMSRQSGTFFPETMAIIGQIALFSFVISGFPLLSGEGYQLLCAYFNQPMLREKSFSYLMGVERKGQKPPTAGEAWAYSLYGLGALLTSALLICLITAYLSTALEARFGGTGVVFFFSLLALVVGWFLLTRSRSKAIRNELLKEIIAEKRKEKAQAQQAGGARSTALTPMQGRSMAPMGQGSGALVPTGNHPLTTVPGNPIAMPGKIGGVYGDNAQTSGWGKWFRRGIVATLAIASTIIAFLPYNYETGGDFVILANDRVQVVAWVSSELADVFVDEGDVVEAGALLAKQVDAREVYRLEVSKAELARVQAQLEDLREGASPEEILVAEQEVERQRIQLPYLEAEADRAKELLGRGFVSPSEAERIIGNFETGKAELRSAEAQLDQVQAAAQATEIAILQADIDRLEAEVAYNSANVVSTEIRAPVAGRIVFEADRPVPGAYYETGALVMEIVGDSTARAEIQVPEADVGLVDVDERVRLKFWALPDEEQIGTVSSLAPVADEVEFGKIVRVKTTLPNPDGLFRPGMTGYGKIEGEQMRVWEAYTRLFVRFFLIELWGWIP